MAKGQKPQQKRKVGRPTKYTAELATYICGELEKGRGLREIVQDEGMPTLTNVLAWVRNNEEFQQQYRDARRAQAELYAEEIAAIADGRDGKTELRDKLRMDARKWIASRLLPKVYGDRVGLEHSGSGGGPITVVVSKELDGLE